MKIIDLTHKLENNMTAYSPDSRAKIQKVATIENNGYEESLLTIYSHNGTHMDSTKHMNINGKTLDTLDIENFAGKAILIDVKDKEYIDLELLKKYEESINECDFVIFNSSWDKFWNTDKYYKDYPVLKKESAKYLANSNIKGIGIDMLSVDTYDSADFEIHSILFDGGKLIVENLTNLENIPNEFLFIAAPLKFNDADGAPVRAMAII